MAERERLSLRRGPGGPPIPGRPAQWVTFSWNGEPHVGVEGEPLAMSLWADGVRVLGFHEETGRPRGIYCAIGQCYECRVTVNGTRDQRACLVPVREGLAAESQFKPADLTVREGLASDD